MQKNQQQKKKQKQKKEDIENIVNYNQMNQMSALNNPQGVDIPLKIKQINKNNLVLCFWKGILFTVLLCSDEFI